MDLENIARSIDRFFLGVLKPTGLKNMVSKRRERRESFVEEAVIEMYLTGV